jgi:hypothetical protein
MMPAIATVLSSQTFLNAWAKIKKMMMIGTGFTHLGGVFLLISLYIVTGMKLYVTKYLFPDVRGPQSGECLTNHTHGVFHHASLDDVAEGRKSAITISLSKYLEEDDRIIPALYVGVDAVFQA